MPQAPTLILVYVTCTVDQITAAEQKKQKAAAAAAKKAPSKPTQSGTSTPVGTPKLASKGRPLFVVQMPNRTFQGEAYLAMISEERETTH